MTWQARDPHTPLDSRAPFGSTSPMLLRTNITTTSTTTTIVVRSAVRR